jgi:transcription-repair coupling factor (superfamily II helicase)
VAHKERLKKMTEGIDVLVLSATPIPRTLQMSLAGVRDMSLIETAPQNRLAIQTNLVPYKRGIIAAAIRNEMRRGGQVFFVHNRVETLPMFAARIVELVPEARVAIAHGQMDRTELEEVILGFLQGNFDVLCSTTIIENGIDMPRVNTLVVNRADRFGLAQLYQLRGRIGRSDVRAYAYFIIPGRGALSPIARRRLVALQEFSELGSGFRLAAMDLEIRGAGELLGPRQHGHIEALGFDLYVQMLERAVQEMQGQEVRQETPAQINLGVDIRIPETYVPEPGLRLAFYKRVSTAEDEAELDEIRAELADRFGALPHTGENLFRLAALRLLAMRAGVKAIDWERVEKPVPGSRIAMQFSDPPKLTPEAIVRYLQRVPLAVLTPSGVLRSPAETQAAGQDSGSLRIEAARGILGRLLQLDPEPSSATRSGNK